MKVNITSNQNPRTFDLMKSIDASAVKDGYVLALYRCIQTGKFHLVYSTPTHTVESAMPCDMPNGGGTWTARESDYGIAYVSNGYSRGHCIKKAKEIINFWKEIKGE